VNDQLCASPTPTVRDPLPRPLRRESRRIRYINAGHNAAILVAPRDRSRGWRWGDRRRRLENVPFEEVSGVPPGSLLVIFSDGVSEAADPSDEFFGEERLAAFCAANRSLGAEGLLRAPSTRSIVGRQAVRGRTIRRSSSWSVPSTASAWKVPAPRPRDLQAAAASGAVAGSGRRCRCRPRSGSSRRPSGNRRPPSPSGSAPLRRTGLTMSPLPWSAIASKEASGSRRNSTSPLPVSAFTRLRRLPEASRRIEPEPVSAWKSSMSDPSTETLPERCRRRPAGPWTR